MKIVDGPFETIFCDVVVGGYHDGVRIPHYLMRRYDTVLLAEEPELCFRVNEDISHQSIATIHRYNPILIVCDGVRFVVYVPEGTHPRASDVMKRMFEGYKGVKGLNNTPLS